MKKNLPLFIALLLLSISAAISAPSNFKDNDIPPGQALAVLTNTIENANLTYYESSKSTAVSNASFRLLGIVCSFDATLNTVATDGSTHVADALLAEFNNNYNAAVNLQDAAKFPNTNESFSLQRNGSLLSIERRPMIVANDTLFFKLTKVTVRNYQFSINMTNMNAPGLFALLEDKYTGTATPLNMVGNTIFNFEVNSNAASSNADRFRVVFSYTSTLPVSYTSVMARQKGKDVEVSWKVEDQLNIAHYEIEKSTDGSNFTTIGTQAITGMNASAYNWTDVNASTGDSYYRIRNVDQDGSFAYSKVVKINMAKTQGGIAVYPNPVTNGSMNVQLSNLMAGTYTVRLVSSAGQLILMQEIFHSGNSSSQKIILPKDIATGSYILETVYPDKITTKAINVIIR